MPTSGEGGGQDQKRGAANKNFKPLFWYKWEEGHCTSNESRELLDFKIRIYVFHTRRGKFPNKDVAERPSRATRKAIKTETLSTSG